MDLVIIFILVIMLNIAAFKWGYNSSDDVNSPEWERRRQRGRAL